MNILKNTIFKGAVLTIAIFSQYTSLASPALPYIPILKSQAEEDEVTVLDYTAHTVGYAEKKGGPVWFAYLRDNIDHRPAMDAEFAIEREVKRRESKTQAGRRAYERWLAGGPYKFTNYLNFTKPGQRVRKSASISDGVSPEGHPDVIAREDPNFKGVYNRFDLLNSRISYVYRENYIKFGGVEYNTEKGIQCHPSSYGVKEFQATEENRPLTSQRGLSYTLRYFFDQDLIASDYGVDAAREARYITSATPVLGDQTFTSIIGNLPNYEVKYQIREGSNNPLKCLYLVLAVTDDARTYRSSEGILCPGAYITIAYYFDAPDGAANYLYIDTTYAKASYLPSYSGGRRGAVYTDANGERVVSATPTQAIKYVEELLNIDLSAAIPTEDRWNIQWVR